MSIAESGYDISGLIVLELPGVLVILSGTRNHVIAEWATRTIKLLVYLEGAK